MCAFDSKSMISFIAPKLLVPVVPYMSAAKQARGCMELGRCCNEK